jgi:hypothetical protein
LMQDTRHNEPATANIIRQTDFMNPVYPPRARPQG